MSGLLAEKIGMTQVFDKNGDRVSVTVLKAGPCTVVTMKTREKDGYRAVQLGFCEQKEKRVTKPYAGHFKKKNLPIARYLKEFRTKSDQYTQGDLLTVAFLQAGDVIDVQGVSKGKGFQGVIKRHHFGGMPASHGVSLSHRAPGSIGQRTWPGKVFKGKRMPGRMGYEKVTTKNLKVFAIEPEQNLLLVKGAVPGANHSLILVYPKGNEIEKRFLEGKQKANKSEEKVETQAKEQV
ncbi:MAG: 50S ribosomal protein L3 [Deltaproteobacteria bacterium RIFCSPLOWO2_12_FULL_40_28]|nr:MAG: 50S ribosomal protein L3 [Deltaproteobacteria bacterium RIFCSPHIGHO2_02_FULL_40_28]OGQ19009.1 MAG: 50S ribosomal protein L3 [Deltaproteobacteria bacterium RIFCSPHIGHO2_12_FULL_40_32]OGQ39552.1 MAG: 50S ribosomal protein L3 [Deltaproteobacteria bacterium RIFCSPLOWO2_02_FULL_40_36]OGQ53442.1 MAG: 50S ribosomal protein L3 [Deltaproteobacteria bacterium RIFCSPLOWO2_12_FULL_40_28]